MLGLPNVGALRASSVGAQRFLASPEQKPLRGLETAARGGSLTGVKPTGKEISAGKLKGFGFGFGFRF